ncbi:MAG: hypothetical protein JWQ74_1936 [Marmoricola sp.]|nr:hypothetical protein [Marmoricola sp.]
MTEPYLPEGSSPDQPIAPGPSTETVPGRGRRRTVWVAAAVAVVVLLGGAAFAAYTVLSGGGPRPADVLPSSTVAVLSVDLDPAAGQKVAAFRALRKVPELKTRLASADDDLRRLVVDALTNGGSCKGLNYDADVKPWLGKRAAVAAVDLGDDRPAPALVLQITDKQKAAAGYRKFAACADVGPEKAGYALGEDYLIASDSTAHAAKILSDGKAKPLADDATYQEWTDAAGGKGVVGFYVAHRATDYLVTELEKLDKQFGGLAGITSGGLGTDSFDPQDFNPEDLGLDDSAYSGGAGRSAPAAEQKCDQDSANPLASVKKAVAGFQGLAGSVRFAGSGLQVSVVAGGVRSTRSTAVAGAQVGSLPRGTALAAGFGVPKTFAADAVSSIAGCASVLGVDPVASLEALVGLKLPEDLATLLGSGVSIAVSGGQPAGTAFDAIPYGVVVHGDGPAIKALVPKVEQSVGVSLADVPLLLTSSADKASLSNSADYGKTLLSSGTLGSSEVFKDVVPDASRAGGVLFVDLAAGARDLIITEAGKAGASAADLTRLRDYTTPLRAVGISTWVDGSGSHLLLKVTTN